MIDAIEVMRFVVGALETTEGRGPNDTVRETVIEAAIVTVQANRLSKSGIPRDSNNRTESNLILRYVNERLAETRAGVRPMFEHLKMRVPDYAYPAAISAKTIERFLKRLLPFGD